MTSADSDGALISWVMGKMAQALGKPPMRMIGVKIVTAGYQSKGLDDFKPHATQFGDIPDSLVADLYSKIKSTQESSTASTSANLTQGQEQVVVGGLQVRKKKPSADGSGSDGSKHVFNPQKRESVLGLDKLAAAKRAKEATERAASTGGLSQGTKRPRLYYEDDDDDDGNQGDRKGPVKASGSMGPPTMRPPKQRQYRGHRVETPSHGTGLDPDARERISQRSRDFTSKRHGIEVTSRSRDPSNSSRSSRWDRGTSSDRDIDSDISRDSESRHRSDRSDYRRDHSDYRRGRDRDRDRGRYRDSRRDDRGGSERDRGGYRGRERERERGYDRRDIRTPSRTGWDDGPRQGHSTWDDYTPVPSRGSSPDRVPRSVRGDPSATPAATPSHHYNSWSGKDRAGQSMATKGVTSTTSSSQPMTEEEKRAYEEEERLADRAWYDQEESGVIDSYHNPFESLGDDKLFEKKEAEMKKRQVKMTARQAQRNDDNNRWEENRMMTAGAVVRREVQTNFDNEDETRVHILVHDIKPPFLDGKKFVYTQQQDMVSTVRDPTSDMAVFARKGSHALKVFRETRDRKKGQWKFWETANTKIGKAIGAKPSTAEEEAAAAQEAAAKKEEEFDYKANSSFATHLNDQKAAAVSDFATSKTMAQQREFLPIFTIKDELMRVIRDNNIVVVVGETGSGKTTQLTQYLLEAGYGKEGLIGCTQPRRVAAVSVAKRVSEERGCALGDEVGYAIRFEDCTSEKTIVKYMTDGVLLRESLNDPDLNQYKCIVMDEAHERSLNTDVLFGILKKLQRERNDLKLIVTSATLDANKFADFFGGVPVFKIPGRTFGVDVMYSKQPCDDYVEASVKQILNIHLSFPRGDILVFMTGQEDIEATCAMAHERLQTLDDPPDLLILPIYSQLPSDLQAKIFEAAEGGVRKCIVATNIAETSLTVDGIRYVIDSGFCKMKTFNPRIGMDALQVTPVSQANANQRSGRAGRTEAGQAFRMYTERAYKNELLQNTVPEIQRTNLGNVVLLLKSLGVKDLLDFDFMDAPPQDNILNSMYQLWVLGALDNTGELTPLGRKMVEFPLDPPLSKMLCISEQYDCTADVLTICAMLSVPTVFFRPKDRAEESDAMREKFFVPESDHLTLLNTYIQWKNNGMSSRWASEHFLHAKAMQKVREIRAQLLDILKMQRMKVISCGTDWDVIRKVICSAYFHNSARLKGIGEYVNMRTGMPCHLHPTSALYGLGYTADYLTYHELVMTTKEYMQCVTAVDGAWLAEMGPMFFSIKELNSTRHQGRKEQKSKVRDMEAEMREAVEKREAEAKAREEERRRRDAARAGAIVTPGHASVRKTPRRFGL
eukprot:TRINITY_DN868_c0_g1_i4.p1 TRINITY_DN868_c0_g1~~TRINITY_DN868_c0_g1_i4.p1  ORF type:complete len:1344 (-),score=333.35 TRINITY_DN868_c0_g1_i4:90-4121(-)